MGEDGYKRLKNYNLVITGSHRSVKLFLLGSGGMRALQPTETNERSKKPKRSLARARAGNQVAA